MIYISIESRKGGVGKTTVSLTLAENLIQKGYQVLVVDMDIIGTRVDGSFLTANGGRIHEVTRNGEAVNLMGLFKKVFMAGQNIPAFAHIDTVGTNYLSFELGKCNVIGSNIYEYDKDDKKDDEKKTDDKLLEDPRILYDALHAYWFVEMVKGMADSFVRAVGRHEKVVVILDNSPGYSSIEKIVNDYLTDLGPEKGKVMLVSTIDPQDIAACRQSKKTIEKLFDDKMAAGKYYRAIVEGRHEEKIDSEVFESIWNSLCASDGKEPEYYADDHEKLPSFTGILVNKVPRGIYDELYAKHILQDGKETAVPFLNHLLYYFCNAMLERNDIHHQTNFGESYEEFKLSGNLITIEDDDIKYRKLRDHIKNSGLRAIFREEWAPLAPFRALIGYLESQEALKSKKIRGFLQKKTSLNGAHSKMDRDVEAVLQFVKDNIAKSSKLVGHLMSVASYITQVMNEANGRDEVSFHPDSPRFAPYDEFVVLFGLAVYKLHIYEIVCSFINELMKYCLDNVEKMETLDSEAIGNLITDIIEGRQISDNFGDELAVMLSNHKNARELEKAIEVILKVWGL